MKIDRLLTLLPCSSLDDLRLNRNPEEAEELLSAWSALWHPALIDCAGAMPAWFPANQPPQEPAGSLIVLPDCCLPLLPDGWLAEADASGALVLPKLKHRPEIVSAAMERLQLDLMTIEPDLTADFLALGFCHLVVELLTQKLRYMSNINEDAFRTAVLAAAKAAVQDDVDAARQQLQSAFDRLHEAREYFYPVEARLVDLTLVASTTLGESLRKELSAELPRNLLISAEVLQAMAQREPATLSLLKESLQKGSVSIVGGEFAEAALAMLPPDAIEFHLQRGLEVYKQLLDRRPVVFGRRRFGLNLALPQILLKNGFTAAVHFTLDDGQFPNGNQSCIQWEGFDGTAIDALCKLPLDVNRVDSFLRLPEKLGNAMELDHPPTLVFAHWPGHVCTWYDDLRRIFSYSRVLGAFYTLDDYFQQAGSSFQRVKYNADQYRSPYLVQDAAASPTDAISRWVRYYHRRAFWGSIETLHTLTTLTTKVFNIKTACGFATNLEKILALLEDSLNPNTPPDSELDALLQKTHDAALQRFSESLTGDLVKPLAVSQRDGYLLINPCSFSHRLGVDLPELGAPPDATDPVVAAAGNKAVVDVPGMGFAWIGPGGNQSSSPESVEKKGWLFGKKHKKTPPLAEENILRNEFFEAVLDPHTGAVRSISDYHSRHPRLAQQIALRMPHDGKQDSASDAHYSIMSADEIRITSTGPICGEIVTSGKIMDRDGRRLAGFRQTARVWRANRVLELEIELDVDRQPGGNPWDSYYACRFAWSDETCDLFRCVNLTTQRTESMHLESPHFIDIRKDPLRTTILCGGLPYHRRIGPWKLDTILVVQGETARSFRLGVGIDLPNPTSAALGFIAPRLVQYPCASPPTNHGWLFHLDHRNVIATRWEPIFMSPIPLGEGQGEGKGPVSFRVRLLETEGHNAQLVLRSFRPVASALKFGLGDTSPIELTIEGDRINIPIGPYQLIDVEIMFA